MKSLKLLSFVFLFLTVFSAEYYAQSPRVISYQAMLTDSKGIPLSGDHTITVRLYSDPEGLIDVWSDTYFTYVQTGLLSLSLGEGRSPLPISLPDRMWLGIQVDQMQEMKPYTPLYAVPYALNAGTATSLAGGAVTSINGKNGSILLKAGNGATVQSEGNAITISLTPSDSKGGQEPQITKVSSVTGTVNQITAAPTTNDVVLSLPQNIHTGATPQFVNMNLTGIPGASNYSEFVVSNGGILQTRSLSSLSGSYWALGGNAGTTPGVNFIGTTDYKSLQFRVNGLLSGMIEVPNNVNDGNTGIGYGVFSSNTTGHGNSANGFEALSSNTVGFWNVAMGDGALNLNTSGSYNTATGTGALFYNDAANFNTADGDAALLFNTTGSQNSATGGLALFANISGSNNTAAGYQSLYSNTTGSGNTASGTFALTTNTTGSNNTALGYLADVSSNALTNATAIGYNAKVGASNSLVLGGTGGDAVKVGIGISSPAQTLDVNGRARIENLPVNSDDNLVIANASGDLSIRSGTGLVRANAWTLTGNSGTLYGTNFLGTTDGQNLLFKVNGLQSGMIEFNGNQNTGIGYQVLTNNTTGSQNTATGYHALYSITTAKHNTATGYQALYSNQTSYYNTAFGEGALYSATDGFNTAIGFQSLYFSTGVGNTASGYRALYSNTTGSRNTANGGGVLVNNTTGFGNTAIGYETMFSNTSGSHNTATGFAAFENNLTGEGNTATGDFSMYHSETGDKNTGSGAYTLQTNISGSKNSALGYSADVGSSNLTNATAIGALAMVTASNCLVLGSINGVNGAGAGTKVGIGVTAPHTLLHVQNGDVMIDDSGAPGSSGIIMKSPNGNCWRVTVNNGGALVVTAIACP